MGLVVQRLLTLRLRAAGACARHWPHQETAKPASFRIRLSPTSRTMQSSNKSRKKEETTGELGGGFLLLLSFSAWGARPYPNTWNVTVNVGALCFPLSSSGVARLKPQGLKAQANSRNTFLGDDLRGSFCCGSLLCCENLIVMYSISLDDEMVRKRRTSVMLNVGSTWRRPPSIYRSVSRKSTSWKPCMSSYSPRVTPSSDLNCFGA